jgi:MinD-like ATPase involved in chromosome partitioning or flagellar assembly
VDVARKLEVPHLHLVINKAISSYKPEDLRKKIEETYDAPVAATIPLSEDVAALQSSDIFSIRFPDHPVTQEIMNIVTTIETAMEMD